MYRVLLCVDVTCPESQNWNCPQYKLPIRKVCFITIISSFITIINRQTSAWAENTKHPLSYFYALLQIYISERSPSSPQESWMFERQWVTGEGEHGHDKPGSTRLPQQWIKHPVFLSLEGITEQQFEGFFFFRGVSLISMQIHIQTALDSRAMDFFFGLFWRKQMPRSHL